MKNINYTTPQPIFDTLEHLCDQYRQCQQAPYNGIITKWLQHSLGKYFDLLPNFAIQEYYHILIFLYNYRGSLDTFNSYRRELERFIQWSWFIKKQSFIQFKRLDIEEFIEFCKKPPLNWIGIKAVNRFIEIEGVRIPNNEWRPFKVQVSKKAFQDGIRPQKNHFELSSQGIKQIFSILSTFYNSCIQEEIAITNPILQIRQKSKFIQKQGFMPITRRLSNTQWEVVIQSAEELASQNPPIHQRTLFIMQCLFGMYLRISELSSNAKWQPKMSDFFRDANGDWWFRTVGKGNKLRQIAVSTEMLQALKNYREFFKLTPLPSPDDKTPLIAKIRGKGAVTSISVIRNLVQECFDAAVRKLNENNKSEEADLLRSATVHWLRHTGISEDVKHRPREHVRDDAGHSSSAITDKYIDVELKERHKSAKHKSIKTE